MTSRTVMHMRSSKEGVSGNNAVHFQSCDCSSYCTALGEIGCINVFHQLRDSSMVRRWCGNSLKTEPMSTTKTAMTYRPWWHQNWWKVCTKQFCRTGASNFGILWSVPPDVSLAAAGNRLPVRQKAFLQRWWDTDGSGFMASDVGGRLLRHRYTINASISVVTMLRSSKWIAVNNAISISYLMMLLFFLSTIENYFLD